VPGEAVIAGGVLETVLYATDIEATVAFYARVLGFVPFSGPIGAAGHGLRLPSGAVLLVFDAARSSRPGRGVPPHGAVGPGHVCFTIEPMSYEAWRAHLAAVRVEIEREIVWPGGGDGDQPARSIYFRDPAGNSVELMAGDYWRHVEAGG
jgi:catechol 2,3-dioxygenase-like lactoylglutathione lyase family enzyme